MRVTTLRNDTGLEHCEWLVWQLEVKDPQRLAPAGVAEMTEAPLTEAAAPHGCVLEGCTDDDSYDGTPAGQYYAWYVRVPRDEHNRHSDDGLPDAIGKILARLASLLPSGLADWTASVEQGFTLERASALALHRAYNDFLQPLEQLLLPMRCDGAEELEARPHVWALDEPTAGTYPLALCEDPAGHAWLMLDAGVEGDAGFWNSKPGKALRRFGVSAGEPVLMTPRPTNPTWIIRVKDGGYSRTARPGSPAAGRATACFEWASQDIPALLERVVTDLGRLYPHLQQLGEWQ